VLTGVALGLVESFSLVTVDILLFEFGDEVERNIHIYIHIHNLYCLLILERGRNICYIYIISSLIERGASREIPLGLQI